MNNMHPTLQKAQHTPGPWTVTTHGSGMICVEAGRKSLCAVGYDNNEDRSDTANARLIAAAPELLEALLNLAAETQKARSYIVISGDDGFAAYNATAEAIITARAAITAATGEGP